VPAERQVVVAELEAPEQHCADTTSSPSTNTVAQPEVSATRKFCAVAQAVALDAAEPTLLQWLRPLGNQN
jgi:hypothetical protein